MRVAAWMLLVMLGCSEPVVGPPPVVTGCSETELATEEGCVGVGVPPEACAEGFAAEAGGCAPVLPEAVCDAGMMALLGEVECRPVVECGSGTWGNIVTDGFTQHVDQAFGGTSDGSSGSPWGTIGEALAQADDGTFIAVAAGTYAEGVVIDRAVMLVGRCPELVRIEGPLGVSFPVDVGPGADGALVAGMSVTGPNYGVGVSGATEVVLEGMVIHDTGDFGLDVEDAFGTTSVELRASVIERAAVAGVYVNGDVDLTIRESEIRDTQPNAQGLTGRGVNAEANGRVTVERSILRANHEASVYVEVGELHLEASYIVDTLPQLGGGFGRSVNAQGGFVSVVGSVIRGGFGAGVLVDNATLELRTTTVTGVTAHPDVDQQAKGISVQNTSGIIESALVADNQDSGIVITSSNVEVTSTIVRGTAGGADGLFGDGVVLIAFTGPSLGSFERLMVAENKRAGIANFGGEGHVLGTRFECNAIHMNAQLFGSTPLFTDEGGNACGCGVDATTCSVLGAELEVPSSLQ